MRNFRWRFDSMSYNRVYGFALTTEGGCLGTTIGEEGYHMFRHFNITFIMWSYELGMSWYQDSK